MDRITLQKETFNTPLRPGHWRYVKRDDTPTIKVSCPECGGESELSQLEHTIEATGEVSPSLVCPRSDRLCGWHAYVTLEHYEGPPAAGVPSTPSHTESRDHTALREAGAEQNDDRVTPDNRNNAARDSAAELKP